MVVAMTSLSDRNEAAAPGRRATIRDVARVAQVGTKTVSRVINNEPNVAPATAERVRNAIAQLRYEPDVHAGSLRRSGGRTRAIGVLLGNLANPFSGTINRAIEDVASTRDVAVFASSLDDDPERERAAVSAFLRRRVDGLILTCAAPSQAYLAEEQARGMPIVFVDRQPIELAADSVVSDNRGGVRLAAEHLIALGHRRIGLFLDRHDLWTARERREGFDEAIAAAGLDPRECPVIVDLHDAAAADDAVTRVMTRERTPTALIGGQNLITIGAIHALRRLDRHRDTALIGFDDIALADLLEPGITVVAQRPAEIGRVAAQRLFDALDAPGEARQHSLTIPVDLIPRGSGEIAPPQA